MGGKKEVIFASLGTHMENKEEVTKVISLRTLQGGKKEVTKVVSLWKDEGRIRNCTLTLGNICH